MTAELAMPLNLVELKRESNVAGILTIISSFVVLGSLLVGYVQTTRAERKVAELKTYQQNLLSEIDGLTKKRDALRREINNFVSTDSTQTVQHPLPTVSGHPVQIYIDVAETRDRAEAEKAAAILRAHGYTVASIDVKRLGEATHDTTVRFFQYDRNTVAIGKNIVETLKGIGFTVRPEFDDEFVGGSSSPPPGTYEFWIGTNPSYSPSR